MTMTGGENKAKARGSSKAAMAVSRAFRRSGDISPVQDRLPAHENLREPENGLVIGAAASAAMVRRSISAREATVLAGGGAASRPGEVALATRRPRLEKARMIALRRHGAVVVSWMPETDDRKPRAAVLAKRNRKVAGAAATRVDFYTPVRV